MPVPAATEAIQAILAPAVMVSASALFLLGLNARYASTLSRIRSLNDEKRRLKALQANPENKAFCDIERLLSVESQIHNLIRAAWSIQKSMLCHILAAIFFVLTSLTIGFNFFVPLGVFFQFSLYLFLIGMLLLLTGISFLGIAMFISYPVILMEVNNTHD